MALLVATGNAHKLEEILAICRPFGLELRSLSDYPEAGEVDEDGATFEANACKKARAGAAVSGLWTLADDSGLEVAALDGAPGVWSARYAGEPPDYAANNAKLLRELSGVSDRRARFCTVVALSDPSGVCRTVAGYCTGQITEALRGEAGFGYDPLFVPDGHARTFAEMDETEKNRISHRAVALARAAAEWAGLLAELSE